MSFFISLLMIAGSELLFADELDQYLKSPDLTTKLRGVELLEEYVWNGSLDDQMLQSAKSVFIEYVEADSAKAKVMAPYISDLWESLVKNYHPKSLNLWLELLDHPREFNEEGRQRIFNLLHYNLAIDSSLALLRLESVQDPRKLAYLICGMIPVAEDVKIGITLRRKMIQIVNSQSLRPVTVQMLNRFLAELAYLTMDNLKTKSFQRSVQGEDLKLMRAIRKRISKDDSFGKSIDVRGEFKLPADFSDETMFESIEMAGRVIEVQLTYVTKEQLLANDQFLIVRRQLIEVIRQQLTRWDLLEEGRGERVKQALMNLTSWSSERSRFKIPDRFVLFDSEFEKNLNEMPQDLNACPKRFTAERAADAYRLLLRFGKLPEGDQVEACRLLIDKDRRTPIFIDALKAYSKSEVPGAKPWSDDLVAPLLKASPRCAQLWAESSSSE